LAGQLAPRGAPPKVAGIWRPNKEEEEERVGRARYLVAISKNLGTEQKIEIFSLFLALDKKLLNTIFVQFFKT
jgi:hypothetical protein